MVFFVFFSLMHSFMYSWKSLLQLGLGGADQPVSAASGSDGAVRGAARFRHGARRQETTTPARAEGVGAQNLASYHEKLGKMNNDWSATCSHRWRAVAKHGVAHRRRRTPLIITARQCFFFRVDAHWSQRGPWVGRHEHTRNSRILGA